MKKHAGVCAGCATGCSIHVEENQDRIYRLKPRENPQVNQWWMCDEGRYGFDHVHSDQRQTEPRMRDKEGTLANIEWSTLPQQLDEQLRAAAGPMGGVLSPHLTVEEALLLGQYLRKIDPEALLVRGPVPRVGEDETFPNHFTIRAEKCPNRRGVDEVLAFLAGPQVSFEDFLAQLSQTPFGAVWISGGYKTDWNDSDMVEAFSSVDWLIVQDLFSSPLWERADVQLPGAAFAERAGSYVNHADRLQSFSWALRPPAGVMIEGSLYWRLLDRSGLYSARDVLKELAEKAPFFAAAADPIPETGVDLKVSTSAAASSI